MENETPKTLILNEKIFNFKIPTRRVGSRVLAKNYRNERGAFRSEISFQGKKIAVEKMLNSIFNF